MRSELLARRFGIACMLVAFAAAVVLAATGAGEAQAAKYQSQRFWATFRAEKTISWSEPRWTGHVDCYHSWWTSAQGRQTETYRSTKPIKVIVYTAGLDSQSTFFKWRTWDEFDEGSTRAMPAMGRIDRTASRAEDWEAGTCGVRGVIVDDEGRERTTPVPPPAQDCGVRQPAVYGSFSPSGRTTTLSVYSAGDDQDDLMGIYRSCELAEPYEMDELRWGDEVRAQFPRAALFNPAIPRVTFRANERYHQQYFVGGARGSVFTSGGVKWSVTLRRAGRR